MSEEKNTPSSSEEVQSSVNNEIKKKKSSQDNVLTAFEASSALKDEKLKVKNFPIQAEIDKIKNPTIKKLVKNDQPKDLTTIFKEIEKAIPQESTLKNTAFPHPRNWIGPRFMALWTFPIAAINKSRVLISTSNPIRPYSQSQYSIENSETIFTASTKGFEGKQPIRFFGARFLTIWVLPLAVTGTIMEFLFVSPLTGVNPFG